MSESFARVLRVLYIGLFYLALPFILLRLLWRARKMPEYAKRWKERFGYCDKPPAVGGIWLHAVSVGEFVASLPLIRRLQHTFPELPITVTTTTPTASARVSALLGEKVTHVYAPYDFPRAVSIFLKTIQPQLVIIMETELWPNWLQALADKNIPVVLANARMSSQSARYYRFIKPLLMRMWQQITVIAAQTDVDAERFRNLGMPLSRIKITGNLKFDQEIPQSIQEIAQQLRTTWGPARPVFIAASTHEGEEELVIQAYNLIRKQLPDCLLLLVPRHPDRFSKVAAMVRKLGFKIGSRGQNNATAQTQVFLGDTMGELTTFYAAADVAFVGGSLVPIGGHNLLEPAAMGVCSLTGPHYFNMTAITDMLIARGATRCVKDVEALAADVIELLQNTQSRHNMGEIGRQIVQRNRGAVKAHVDVLTQLIT